VGDAMVVYFTGLHTDLRTQLQKNMAKVILQKMMYGDNFRDVLRNAIVQHIPAWISEGYTDYLIEGWNSERNDEWKNMIEAYPHLSFFNLAEIKPKLCGIALWKWVTEKYGINGTRQLMYNMMSKGNLGQAIK